MDRWQYLIVLAACLAVTLPLEFGVGARVYRSPRRLLLAMAPMLAVFVTWDVAGILRGHWWYEERFVSGSASARCRWRSCSSSSSSPCARC